MQTDVCGIMVYVGETGTLRGTLELLGEARILAAKLGDLRGGDDPGVGAVLCGCRVEEKARELSRFADRVYLCDSPLFSVYHPGRYATVLSSLARKYRPEIMLFPACRSGQELAATVAARLGTGLAAHAVGLDIDPRGRLVQLVATFGDGVLGEILCPVNRPQMATVPPGLFAPATPRAVPGGIVHEQAPDDECDGIVVTAVEEKNGAAGRLEDAPLVLAGGCGLRDEGNWRALEELGALLHAPVCCTRPVLDAGWQRDEERMIGISGAAVAPAVYLALGISGSTHHTVGMERSGYVIAVNNDPGAPLLGMADLAVVGDAAAVVREMLRILSGEKESRTGSDPPGP